MSMFLAFSALILVLLAIFLLGDPPLRPPVADRISIDFDDTEFRVHRHDGETPTSSEHFQWKDVTRVCFIDAGLYNSDVILIEVRGREQPIGIPTECAGGTEFFGKLCDSGLFPEEVSLKAVRETGGRTHCWPPHEQDVAH
ncbi:hypothetical protein [Roseateles sp.]|uniref:hypothetical protein n=1 Tax=Roseateles sp. TaxID=1971397 RepID=UPI0031DFC565